MDTTGLVQVRRRRSSARDNALDIERYKSDMELSLPARTAHYLNWAAAEYPRQFTPYNLIVKAVMGYKKGPRIDSEEVNNFRTKMTRAAQFLRSKHGRELVSEPGIGVRATVDDSDTLKTAMPRKLRRLESAKNSVINTATLIDVKALPNTPEMRPWAEWYRRGVGPLVKLIGSDDFVKKLLPPMTETPSEEK